MGAFTVSKNGYRLYTPSWQQNPGAAMRAANRAAAQSYYDNATTLGGNLISGIVNSSTGMAELSVRIANERIQKQLQDKLEASQTSMLDTLA